MSRIREQGSPPDARRLDIRCAPRELHRLGRRRLAGIVYAAVSDDAIGLLMYDASGSARTVGLP